MAKSSGLPRRNNCAAPGDNWRIGSWLGAATALGVDVAGLCVTLSGRPFDELLTLPLEPSQKVFKFPWADRPPEPLWDAPFTDSLLQSKASVSAASREE